MLWMPSCPALCAALQMGLGKTAQSISVLAYQRQFGNCRGPFLGGFVG